LDATDGETDKVFAGELKTKPQVWRRVKRRVGENKRVVPPRGSEIAIE